MKSLYHWCCIGTSNFFLSASFEYFLQHFGKHPLIVCHNIHASKGKATWRVAMQKWETSLLWTQRSTQPLSMQWNWWQLFDKFWTKFSEIFFFLAIFYPFPTLKFWMTLQFCGWTFENTEFCFALSMTFSRVTKFTGKTFANFRRKVMLVFLWFNFFINVTRILLHCIWGWGLWGKVYVNEGYKNMHLSVRIFKCQQVRLKWNLSEV